MQTIEINKGNWTGEKHELSYDSDSGEFEIYEEIYRLTPEYDIDGFTSRDLIDPSGRVICPINKDGDIWFCSAYGINREDANPYIAAAQLLFNIV